VPDAGIADCRQRKRSVGQIILGSTQNWKLMEPDQMRGWLVYV
jgi:hypothetical protein